MIIRIFTVCFILITTGCSTYSHRESPSSCAGSFKNEITYFSINVVSQNKSTWLESEVRNITKENLATAEELNQTEKANSNGLHLQVQATQGDGYGNGLELFTGISLGLIPSWSNIENIYTYEFTISKAGNIIAHKTYAVDRHNYAHLVLVPFGIAEMYRPPYQPATENFRAALKSAINMKCTES